MFLLFLKEVFFAHQGCIYFNENFEILLHFKITIFLWECIVKCNLFLWSKLNFQHHYSSIQCHMILQKLKNLNYSILIHYFNFWMIVCIESIHFIHLLFVQTLNKCCALMHHEHTHALIGVGRTGELFPVRCFSSGMSHEGLQADAGSLRCVADWLRALSSPLEDAFISLLVIMYGIWWLTTTSAF